MRKRYHDIDLEKISDVHFAKHAPFPRKVAKKACIKEGLEFEARAQRWLEHKMPISATHLPSKWISYTLDKQACHAQPDSIIIHNNTIYIFEMKLRHTPRSAAQLAKYARLLHLLYPIYEVKLIEVYKYWDWVAYPSDVSTLSEDSIFAGWPSTTIGLLHLTL